LTDLIFIYSPILLFFRELLFFNVNLSLIFTPF